MIPIGTLMTMIAKGPGAVVPMVLETAPNTARAIVLARLGSIMAQAGSDLAIAATDAVVASISGGADATDDAVGMLWRMVDDIAALADVMRDTTLSAVRPADLAAAFQVQR